MNRSDMKKKIQEFPKKKLINSPTPFYKLGRLSNSFGWPEIYIKRGDLTGLAFGGNKSRKLEFIIHDALDKNADTIITWGSLQSNWCLQTAAAARKFGMMPVLILFKSYDIPGGYDGNMLLDLILDADVRIKDAEKGGVVKEEDVKEIIEEIVVELEEKKHSPYVAPIGGSMLGGSMERPYGAIAYVDAFIEMIEQSEVLGFEPDYVVHASGSGSTQAGLIVGAKLLSENIRILGVSVSDKKEILEEDIFTIVQDTENALGLDFSVAKEDIIVFDEYIDEGYGIVSKRVAEAIRFVAVKEGIFLDPIYTGKAMSGLIDLVDKGYFNKDDKVVFFHTGGTPALFPNKEILYKFLKS